MVFFGKEKYFPKKYKIRKMKKWMNVIAYFSLFLDIMIAVLTLLSIWQIGNPKEFLIPVEILLTIVVILSIGLGGMIIWLNHYEKILTGIVLFTNTFKSIKKNPPQSKYSYKASIVKKIIRKIFKWF
jgi:hypothetical protein